MINIDYLMEFLLSKAVMAIGIIILGVVFGKIIVKIFNFIALKLYKKQELLEKKNTKNVMKLLQLFIFIVSIILSLSVLNVNFAREISSKFGEFFNSFLIVILFILLGYILVTILIILLKNFSSTVVTRYLKEFGISSKFVDVSFIIIKVFLIFIMVSIALKVANTTIPILDSFIIVLLFAFVFVIVVMVIYAYKDYFSNFLLSSYISRNILKQGQIVNIGDKTGEVTSITNHGTIIALEGGYTMIVPNTQIIKEKVILKNSTSDLSKIEHLISKYVVQLPSNCGPASVSMLLDFFGYKTNQKEIGELVGTKNRKEKIPEGVKPEDFYGSTPEDLISAVKKLTNSKVRGELIKYTDIYNLKDEVKSWITEGALNILWYKKPVLFPEKKSKSGHFVLAVGVEGDDIIIMDPSSQTAGVYAVNYEKMEKAMEPYDKSRGYIVFAKEGSPAFWRLTEGLIYSDVSAYKDLSKSLERHLKRILRKNNLVKSFISPYLEKFFKKEKNIKPLWKPDISKSSGIIKTKKSR